MANDITSGQIYLSRDQIRAQISDYLKSYLELENVDLTKSSFLSFVINILSTLTSNLLFYESSVYKEFFLTKAQLPESVLNLSAFLGYNTGEANYAVTDILMTLPFGFEDAVATFTIPSNFKFSAKDIQFRTFYTTTVVVTANASVNVTINYDNKRYDVPVSIDSTNHEFSFLLPVRQYKITQQSFQIDQDLQPYQFTDIEVPISGQVSTLSVEVTPPGSSSPITYTEFESLYLMTSTDYGYVSRKTSKGRRLYFGNGLIGQQPTPGSSVDVTIYETEGADGNVIASSINTGDRIYISVLSGQTKIVEYSCINTAPATDGEDEESTQEIRSNSIKNLVSMSRLVSETDFKNLNVVVPNSPYGTSLPILKRSDVKCNEVQIFTTLNYDGAIVPTRNASYMTVPTETYLAKNTLIDVEGISFYTLFDMEMDYINGSAYYHYILNSLDLTPALNVTYNDSYDLISIGTLHVYDSTSDAVFELNYTGTDTSASCVMELLETSEVFTMVNDTVNKKFTYTFSPYTLFPDDEVNMFFTISSTAYGNVMRYSSKVTFRKDLRGIMMSNLISDSTSAVIYDIPVIEKDYYDALTDKETFELETLQALVETTDLESYRMLTDFVNIKLTNTTGNLVNMKKNKSTRLDVIDIINTPPSSPVTGERYIVGDNPTGIFIGHKNAYAHCIDSVLNTWYYFTPSTNDVVYVTNKGSKYLYTGTEWMIPEFEIPLQLNIELFKSSSYFGSESALVNTVKDTLISAFSDRFGINCEIYRSELVKCIQEVSGVDHCNLLTPKCDIFFNFSLEDLSRNELLSYGPEYVYFTEDSISITIY